jgi:hypothetical protein
MSTDASSGEQRFQEEGELAARRNAITQEIFHLVKCRRAFRKQNNIALGRKLTEAKNTFTKHGEWTRYYAEIIGPEIDITLNAAQRYMALAREEGEKLQTAFFGPATDSESKEIETATQAAKQEVDRERQLTLRLNLRLNREDEKGALAHFCKSKKWPLIERRLIKLLKDLYQRAQSEDLHSAA